ncbi:hypothetical protein EUTSA_v10022182mg [Eutrema salsugineum]|uniref:EF-hand domain-containing protein n=1 Tax=Eutrema salsugineum TaxID=72664 RepID=V4MBC6_EUTSA|nr:probable calcium-binding protein CML34 [Eutrema salsugineum]ESQ49758.1 hypothetical protein EUTSA_v10022182mg [Eutrema salsugineum]
MSARQIFEKFDKNKDGKLSLDEFHEAALAFFNNFSQEDISSMFKEMDVDGDGELDADEFTSCIEKMLKDVFDFCDVDGDGKIPADELYVSMTKLGKECTEESCAEKVRLADADSDGYLSFEEFTAMVLSDF